jgi:hypothetical protein
MCVCYLREFPSENVYKTNRKRANPRFRIAAIYPSVNIQPLMKTLKIDIQHNIRYFILIKCSEQKARFKKSVIMS